MTKTVSQISLGLLALALAAAALFAPAIRQKADATQVGFSYFCHRGAAFSNPYQAVPFSSGYKEIDGEGANDHTLHTGDVFDPQVHSQQNNTWGDIIPPVPDVLPNGMNWTEEGQKIYYNDCAPCDCEDDSEFLQIVKEWTGDEINLDNVTVTFTIGKQTWSPGDDPIAVDPGDVIEPLSETVTGMPENCTYESDLPDSYTVPEEEVNSIRTDGSEEPTTHTLTVTNKVTCEEDEDDGGEVLGTDTQVEETPTGGVNAGGGASAGVAVAGTILSAVILTAGIVVRRFSIK